MVHVVAYHMATTTIAACSSGIASSCKSQYTSSIEIRYIRGSIHIKYGITFAWMDLVHHRRAVQIFY